jgi:hypothetical protein
MSGDRILREIANAEKRARQLPAGAVCVECGAQAQLAIVGDEVRCYAHLAASSAQAETHHLALRANLGGLTVDLEPNAHRNVTDLQRKVGALDLPPADGDPLLLLGAFLIGVGLLLVVLGFWLFAYVAGGPGGAPPFPLVP